MSFTGKVRLHPIYEAQEEFENVAVFLAAHTVPAIKATP
jgi:hypothetical protein